MSTFTAFILKIESEDRPFSTIPRKTNPGLTFNLPV